MNNSTTSIEHIMECAIRVMGTKELAERWFRTPVLALGGKTPIETMSTENGTEEVLTILGRIEHGVYS